jgi:TPR repeat protein
MKDKIFICYRREDTAAYAALLHARLTEKLGTGRVFIDIDSIGPGIDFVDSIAKAIPVSALVLVLIGRRWSPPRLGNPRDFVRIELLAALEQNARIIPLLFEGVEMPRPEELPAELVPLTRRNAVEIGTSRLNAEIRDLVEEIERILIGDHERLNPSVVPLISTPQRPQSPPPLPFHQPSPPAYIPPPTEPKVAEIVSSPPPGQKSTGDRKKGRRTGLALLLLIAVAISIWALSRGKKEEPAEEKKEMPRAEETPFQEYVPEAPRIGVTYRMRAFSENFIRERGLPDLSRGLEVSGIFPGSSAERAGLLKGDILRKIDGQPIFDLSDLPERVDKHKVGDHILLEVWRGARAMDISIPVENGLASYKHSCEGGLAEGCVFLGSFYQNEGKDPARAAALYRQACEAGYGEGCLDLGFLYEHGTGVAKDPARASALYEQACTARNGRGCLDFGFLLENGTGMDQDPARAALFYQKACSLQEWIGCTSLGSLYAAGLGVAKDPTHAVLLYGQACDAGEAGGCFRLGVATENGEGVDKDLTKAAVHYRVACNGGDNLGCDYLGDLYQNGQGVQQDLKLAADFYDRGCKGNLGLACAALGYLYRDGRGFEKDSSRALTLFQRACDLGSPEGCSELGLFYLNGTAVTKDPARAFVLFKGSCDAGNAVACNNLGVRYEDGSGIDKDVARAAALYRQACDSKVMVACRNLGSLYERGLGVPKDLQKSAELYRQACSGGDSTACTQLKAGQVH